MADQPNSDDADLAAAPSNVSQEEQDELARLITSAKRKRPADIDRMRALALQALTQERQAAASQANDVDGADEAAQLTASYNTSSAVHRFIHAQPYHDDPAIARAAQWHEVLARFKDLGDEELNDWLRLQIEVAANIEAGIPDHRPRKDGPTFLIMLEFVANRKRKALAVLHWFEGARR